MPDLTPRQSLLLSLTYAVKRLPKSLLQRLQREHVTDDPAHSAAEHILRQLKLSYRVTARGLEQKPPPAEAGRMTSGEGKMWETKPDGE
jgi:hypothetical protein